jgi:hypothetical protein
MGGVLCKVDVGALSGFNLLTTEVEPDGPVFILDLIVLLRVLQRGKVISISFFRDNLAAFKFVIYRIKTVLKAFIYREVFGKLLYRRVN